MIDKEEPITVQIKYRDLSKTLTGSAEQVWLAMHELFNRFLPTFEIADRLVLRTDLKSLATDCEGILAFSDEGLNLLISRSNITDSETIALTLLGTYLGFQLGRLNSESVSREELQSKLGKSSKIFSTRLGELVKSELVVRTTDDKYKLSTLGVVQVQKEMLARIKARTKNAGPKT